ncbi:hypothetical protein PTKIN_Ptkin14bG0177200 [Pterospermum kingtungense]
MFSKVLGNLTQLQHLLLDGVNMSSVLPTSFLNMSSYITTLTLDTNQLRVKFPADLFRFPCLQKFSLNDNFDLQVNFPKSNWSVPLRSFEVSRVSSLGEHPDSIGNLKSLEVALSETVDLGNNEIYGPISSFSKFVNLIFLDLSSTKLYGNFEVDKKLNKLRDLYLSNNAFISLTSRRYGLGTLDLSYNRIQMIEMDMFLKLESLSYLDLSNNSSLTMNHFHGNIPDSFVEGNVLRTLNLNKNNFEVPLPKSLINCHDLEVLNLGNNKINDTFPHWLATLPKLQVLVLRANYFHGQIIQSEYESHFSALRILDISRNEFSGLLPTTYFKSFKGMMNLSDVQLQLQLQQGK